MSKMGFLIFCGGALFIAVVASLVLSGAPPAPSGPTWRPIGRVEAQGGTYLHSFADVTLSGARDLIDARSLGRVSLACTNTNTTVHARVGNIAITTSRGLQVRATTGFTTDSQDDVYGITEGADVVMACTKEMR